MSKEPTIADVLGELHTLRGEVDAFRRIVLDEIGGLIQGLDRDIFRRYADDGGEEE